VVLTFAPVSLAISVVLFPGVDLRTSMIFCSASWALIALGWFRPVACGVDRVARGVARDAARGVVRCFGCDLFPPGRAARPKGLGCVSAPLAVSAVSIARRVASISSVSVTYFAASALKSAIVASLPSLLAGLVHLLDQPVDDALLELNFAFARLFLATREPSPNHPDHFGEAWLPPGGDRDERIKWVG
jgi:hypothetical protein